MKNHEIYNSIINSMPKAEKELFVYAKEGDILTLDNVESNIFLTNLLTKIGKQIFGNPEFYNKLNIFHKGFLEYGLIIEDIFTEFIESLDYYRNEDDGDRLLNIVKPLTKANYYTTSKHNEFKVSVSPKRLKSAFNNEFGLKKLIQSIMKSIISSINCYQYQNIEKLIANYCLKQDLNGNILKFNTNIPVFDSKSDYSNIGVDLLKTMKKLTYKSNLYNANGVFTNSNFSDLIALSPIEAYSNILHNSRYFNRRDNLIMDIENAPKKYKNDKNIDTDINTLAIILDINSIQLYNRMFEVECYENKSSLTNTYFFHVSDEYGVSLFNNFALIKGV